LSLMEDYVHPFLSGDCEYRVCHIGEQSCSDDDLLLTWTSWMSQGEIQANEHGQQQVAVKLPDDGEDIIERGLPVAERLPAEAGLCVVQHRGKRRFGMA